MREEREGYIHPAPTYLAGDLAALGGSLACRRDKTSMQMMTGSSSGRRFHT